MADNKRDAFRKFLESGNVIETLNRAMIALHELDEPPEDPVQFIRQNIGSEYTDENLDALIRENQDLKARYIKLQQELAVLEGKGK